MDLSIFNGFRRIFIALLITGVTSSVYAEKFTFEDIVFEDGEQFKGVQDNTIQQGDFVLTVYEGVLVNDNYSAEYYGESFHPNTGTPTDPISNVSLVTQYFKLENTADSEFIICSMNVAETRSLEDQVAVITLDLAFSTSENSPVSFTIDGSAGYQLLPVNQSISSATTALFKVEEPSDSPLPMMLHFDNIELSVSGSCN